MTWLISLALVTLHTVDARVIYVNPAEIVSLVEPLDAGQKQYEGSCVIHFADGKSRGVAETCEEVKNLLGAP